MCKLESVSLSYPVMSTKNYVMNYCRSATVKYLRAIVAILLVIGTFIFFTVYQVSSFAEDSLPNLTTSFFSNVSDEFVLHHRTRCSSARPLCSPALSATIGNDIAYRAMPTQANKPIVYVRAAAH